MGDFNDLSKSLLTYFIFFLPVAFRRNFFSFFRTVIYRMFIVPSNRPLDDISWKGTKMKRRKVFTFCYVFSQFCGAHRAHSLYYTQYVHNYFFPMFCDITTISGTWNSCWMNNTPYKKNGKNWHLASLPFYSLCWASRGKGMLFGQSAFKKMHIKIRMY